MSPPPLPPGSAIEELPNSWMVGRPILQSLQFGQKPNSIAILGQRHLAVSLRNEGNLLPKAQERNGLLTMGQKQELG